MAGANTAVFGIYSTRAQAEEAVDALRQAGFRNTDISALFPDNQGSKDFAVEKNTKVPEGATTGATTGAVAGGILGWLAGIGALAIPGVGPFIAAGPIMGALAGAGTLGVAGGIVGALCGMGIPEYEAKRYEGRVKNGGILLSVHSDSSEWTSKAKDILERTGAEDVSSAGEKAVSTHTVGDRKLDPDYSETSRGTTASERSRTTDTADLDYDADRVTGTRTTTTTTGKKYDI
ncbi:MAG: general stress protein [Acidobacteriota bacterium]|nr:general stress protein [Acidobacteriota bacterium]